MPKFVELWVYLSATPLFGLTATLVVYVAAQAVYTRLGHAPWVPKSVTAPVAMGIAEQIGGIPELAAVFAVLTGLVGALSGKYLFDGLRIPTGPAGWAARGFALGTASHGIGAARAMQVNADAGAYAGLALGLQVVLASLLMPLAFRLF
ncbi:MAG: LrgB family protein [Polaromonas sp.]